MLILFSVYYRNLVYNLSLSDLNQQQKLTWFSNEHDAKMCVMKGKDEVSRAHFLFLILTVG
jgi:semaphorin 6